MWWFTFKVFVNRVFPLYEINYFALWSSFQRLTTLHFFYFLRTCSYWLHSPWNLYQSEALWVCGVFVFYRVVFYSPQWDSFVRGAHPSPQSLKLLFYIYCLVFCNQDFQTFGGCWLTFLILKSSQMGKNSTAQTLTKYKLKYNWDDW